MDTCKNALNMVKAWNLVEMNLFSCQSKVELGLFRKYSSFVCMPEYGCVKGKIEKLVACIQETEVTREKNS